MENLCESLKESGTVICRLPGHIYPGRTTRNKAPEKDCLSGLALFRNPEKIFTVNNIIDTSETLKKIENSCRKGYYAAGFISYEISPAFDNAFQVITVENSTFPFLWFGIYKQYHNISQDLLKNSFCSDSPKNSVVIDFEPEFTKKEYMEKIKKLKEYILNGDIYQANFTFRAISSAIKDPENFFLFLIHHHPVQYPAFVNIGTHKIISLSPELFFETTDTFIFSAPMKGTAKRALSAKEDKKCVRIFAQDKKNQAENVMITDMVRNDIGKISLPGTVKVPKLFHVDSYVTLHQMISVIKGTISLNNFANTSDFSGIETIFKALFPPASITGAPKVRAMEIISETEKSPRRVYTGTIGCIIPKDSDYLHSPGSRKKKRNIPFDMCFNVAIRTIIQVSDLAIIGIGSGIVADSQPEDEWKECLLKKSFSTYKYENFALIETILWTKDTGFLYLGEHLARAKKSQGYFLRQWNKQNILNGLYSAEKILKKEKGDLFKVRILIDAEGKCSVSYAPLSKKGWGKKRLNIKIASEHTDSRNVFLYHKTTIRSIYDKAFKQALSEGYDEVMFLNEKGELTEGAISNVFIKKQNKWFTPVLKSGLLPGIWREKMIKKLKASEKVIMLHELLEADEIIIGNSVRGTSPPVSVAPF